MWTRLLYLTVPQAFKATLVNGKWHRPVLSGRYQRLLKKSFREAGVPWTYTQSVPKLNPRHKTPKGHGYDKEKPLKLAKIKKALESQPEAILKYRQEQLNKRKLSGFDHVLKEALPSFLIPRKVEAVAESKSRADLDHIPGQLVRKQMNYNKKKPTSKKPGETSVLI